MSSQLKTVGWWMLALSATAVVLAGCAKPEKAAKSVFGGTAWIEHALMGKVYLLPENTAKLPDFKTLKPVGTIYADKIDIPTRDWQEGFPGVTDRFEWFAIDYQGSFRVHTPGSYNFRLLSDDGSKLYVDDKPVIDNDGTHGPSSQEGKVQLDGSAHTIDLQYFQGPRTQIALQLFYNIDGAQEQIFPGADFELTTPGQGSILIWWILILVVVFIVIWFVASRRRKTEPIPESSDDVTIEEEAT